MYIIIYINASYSCISNKGLLEECDKEQNLAVNGAATASFLERRFQNVLPSVTYSPSHRQAGSLTINIQSTFCTAPICVQMFHCGVIR